MVVGGGCYGTFYATQLAKAKARGKAAFRTVLIVDRDPDCRARRALPPAPDRSFVTAEWSEFFDRYLDPAQPPSTEAAGDYIVPSPHMSHLMFEWLARWARARHPARAIAAVPVPGSLGTPYDRPGGDHTRFVSFADWICPTHCVEPAICPATGGARTWEMPYAVRVLAEELRGQGQRLIGPALFVCRHHVFGVGTFPVDEVLEAARLVQQVASQPVASLVLVGTVSACHGALNLLRIGEAPPALSIPPADG